MKRTMRSILLLVLFLAGAARAEVVRVEIRDGMKFVPEVTRVNPGDTIEFVNVSRLPHTVTADPALVKDPGNVVLPEGAAPFHSGRIEPGARFEHKFDEPGSYQYVCLPHEAHGMKGRVEVASPVPSRQVACEVAYYLGSEEVGRAPFQGSVKEEGGIAISQDFTLADVVANFHVYYEPKDGFISINYFHEPTDTYLNTDSHVVPGKDVLLLTRNRQGANGWTQSE